MEIERMTIEMVDALISERETLRVEVARLTASNEALLAQVTWRRCSERMPDTGAICWIVWSGHVQEVAYRRVGVGFDCCEGYVWTTAQEIGADDIPDGEVEYWIYHLAPPTERP